jgi:hypothetical protein
MYCQIARACATLYAFITSLLIQCSALAAQARCGKIVFVERITLNTDGNSLAKAVWCCWEGRSMATRNPALWPLQEAAIAGAIGFSAQHWAYEKSNLLFVYFGCCTRG